MKNCKNIRRLLSEYIDNQLSEYQKKQIEEHLAVCGECKKEFEMLSAYVRDIHAVKKTVAPADFAAEVLKKIEAQKNRSIINRLFFPFHIKIPLEVAGVLASMIVVVLVFHSQIRQRTDFREEKPMSMAMKQLGQTQAAPASGLQQRLRSSGIDTDEAVTMDKSSKPAEKFKTEDKRVFRDQSKLADSEMNSIAQPPEFTGAVKEREKVVSDALSFEAAPSRKVRKEAVMAEKVSEDVISDLSSLYMKDTAKPVFIEVEFTPKSDIEQSVIDVRKAIGEVKGVILSEKEKPHYTMEVRLVEAIGNNYQILIRKLKSLGDVKAPKVEVFGETILLRITIKKQ